MVSPERLLDLIFFWMGHRGECADGVSLAAGELRSGMTPNTSRQTAELLASNSSMRDAKQQDQMTSQICADIQQLFQQLKEQSHSVAEELLQSLGKRGGFSEDELNFGSLITVDQSAPRIDRTLTTNLLKILAFFGLTVEDEGLKGFCGGGAVLCPSGAKETWEELLQWDHVTDLVQRLCAMAERMMKSVDELRTAFRCISEAFEELKDVQECIEDPGCVCRRTKLLQYAQEHCAEPGEASRGRCGEAGKASRGLCGEAGETSRESGNLKSPWGEKAAFGQFAVNQATPTEEESWRRRAHEGLIRRAIGMCRSRSLREWLQEEGNTDAFLGLVDLFRLIKHRLHLEHRRRKRSGQVREIDIIFVAHGSITGRLMSPDMLLPTPSLRDVVLYQPWNCTINATVAFGIAAGTIEPGFCQFICDPSCPHAGSNHDQHHNPTTPSRTWNSMRESGGLIPEIHVSPLRTPQDGAWEDFKILAANNRYPNRDRVLIPFKSRLLQGARVPFSVVTLALSLVLKFSGLKARLHLAACLGRDPASDTSLDLGELAAQYCVTPDNTMMTSTQDLNVPRQGPAEELTEEERQIFKLFKDLFG